MWNNRKAALIILIATVSLLTSMEIEARGGGRGGGGGGGSRSGGGRSASVARSGGAYRGGSTMNRTPTMSRATSRPSQAKLQSRPSVAQNRMQQTRQPIQQTRQSLQQRPSAANRTELRNQVQQYAQSNLQSRPAQTIDRQALSQRTQNFSNQRANQITQNRDISQRASQRLRQSQPNSSLWFDGNFFNRHNLNLDYAQAGTNLWRPAAWATLATWGAWNWSTPYYYDDGGYVYPLTTTESTYNYPYDATNNTTTSTSYQSLQTQPAPTQTAVTTGEWLSLGVFAVANNANAALYTNRFMQLAINRRGEIAGVLYNSSTDAAQDLVGLVDSKSQKAYWSLADKVDSPVASTGIYNLTEDQTSVNVHFTDGSDQTWSLVRLQQEN